ncbi:flagellar hook-associated protein FlgL [Thiomicrospira sp. WB1]|uniref:flagellar hook-associated protein FlgL n=1 Tax=Thiomicrospira sp. WB1 TaxID=1685380 RepID=UPI0007477CE0|nr:flagellar hook-associated protein FlgL [Thiomicrospira sp. WB1]KUJ71611.1 flagellin-like protein [Thiomicrospira sp. WB1]
MRVSTDLFNSQGYNSIADHQEAIMKLQQQLSSGKRITKPSDDPVATTQVHSLKTSMETIKQFERNGEFAKSQLTLEETQIKTTVELTQRARDLAIQMSNGTYNAADKRSTAAEITQIIEHMRNLMNSTNSEDELLFAGNQVNAESAFVEDPNTAGYYSYIGSPRSNGQVDSAGNPVYNEEANFGSRFVQISFDDDNTLNPNDRGDASRVRVTDNGGRVFNVGAGSLAVDTDGDGVNDAQVDNNILNVMVKFRDNLLNHNNNFDAEIDDMTDGIKQMTEHMASIGGRQNRIEAQYEAGQIFSMSLEERRMNLEDMDIVKGITDLTTRQNALQMAQQIFSRTQNMSLFQYLN